MAIPGLPADLFDVAELQLFKLRIEIEQNFALAARCYGNAGWKIQAFFKCELRNPCFRLRPGNLPPVVFLLVEAQRCRCSTVVVSASFKHEVRALRIP